MIVLTLPTGVRFVKHATTNDITTARNVSMYRPPFSHWWRAAGSGQHEPQTVGISIEVWAGTRYEQVMSAGEPVTIDGDIVIVQDTLTSPALDDIAPVLDAIVRDAEAATWLETPYGVWPLEGLQSAVPVPMAGGYRLNLSWLAATRRNVNRDGSIIAPTTDTVMAGVDVVVANGDVVVAS